MTTHYQCRSCFDEQQVIDWPETRRCGWTVKVLCHCVKFVTPPNRAEAVRVIEAARRIIAVDAELRAYAMRRFEEVGT